MVGKRFGIRNGLERQGPTKCLKQSITFKTHGVNMSSKMFNEHHWVTMLGQPEDLQTEIQEATSEKVTFGWSRAQASLHKTL